MTNKLFKNKEPLFHVVKRTDIPSWKAWLFRGGAILFGILIICLLLLIMKGANPFVVLENSLMVALVLQEGHG
jgi:hypothetical protein